MKAQKKRRGYNPSNSMSYHTRFFAPFLALSVLGAGCNAQVAPRITQAPQTTNVAQGSSNGVAVAYVHLNGGAATVYRGTSSATAVDNAELDSGDRIVVSSGNPTLVYPQTGESQLSTGSDVTLIAKPNQAGLFAEAEISAGDIWTRLERLLGPAEHFSVDANGVVATVRGTAFGVTVNDIGTLVQVADHFVDVSSDQESEKSVIRVGSGNGMSAEVESFSERNLARLPSLVYSLDESERASLGYRFALTPLSARDLSPATSFQLFQTPPVISASLSERLIQIEQQPVAQPTTQTQATAPIQFVAPTFGATAQNRAPTSTAPSVRGPNGQ